MSTGREQLDFDLTLRDKMNHPALLAKGILTFQASVLNKSYSRREIIESIQGFINIIPERWEDKQFEADKKAAEKEVDVDIRPKFAGVPQDIELCKAEGIPITKKAIKTDHWALLKAGINLLERRGMLSRREFTEKATGLPIGEKALPKGMSIQDLINQQMEGKNLDEILDKKNKD